MTAKANDKVKVHYKGMLENGQVFDSSEGKGPLEFTAGEGKVIPGFDKGVLGMEVGEEKEVKIECKDAYGEKNPDLIKKIPKDSLPEDSRDKIAPGMILAMQTPTGQQVPVKVEEVSEEDFTIDLNHPLAGQNLNFKIKVVDIE